MALERLLVYVNLKRVPLHGGNYEGSSLFILPSASKRHD